jgi:hypothetical protein
MGKQYRFDPLLMSMAARIFHVVGYGTCVRIVAAAAVVAPGYARIAWQRTLET